MTTENCRPFVAVNFAMTWDGKISTRNLTPSDFSSKKDKRRLLEIRASGDALLVGRGTLETENMQMGLPAEDLRAAREKKRQAPFPIRVIISNSGRIDPALKLFKHDFSPIVIYSTNRMPRHLQKQLAAHATLHLAAAETVDLHEALQHLRAFYKVKRLICEGGATLFHSLAAEGLVDEVNLTLCPRIFGGTNAPTLTGLPAGFLPRTIACKLAKMEVVGDECFLRYKILGAQQLASTGLSFGKNRASF